jgi:hypothetical protein
MEKPTPKGKWFTFQYPSKRVVKKFFLPNNPVPTEIEIVKA